MRLFRPVGLHELRLIYEAEMRAFPPRLPEQPIFYPVLNEPYAIKIAREWNTKSNARVGFVTRFDVDDEYVRRFERKIVGSRDHEELWIPAEELATFNQHIRDAIQVTAAYFGDDYEGFVPAAFGLKGKTAREQFVALAKTLPYSSFDVVCELAANHVAVFLNYFFWENLDVTKDGMAAEERDRILERLKDMWAGSSRSAIPLGVVT